VHVATVQTISRDPSLANDVVLSI